MKKFSCFLIALMLCVLSVSTFAFGDVSARWDYYPRYPADALGISFHLEEKYWTGSDILPDDEEEGQDHKWLIENLVYGENIGLNYKNSDLNDYINDRLKGGWNWKRDYFGSMAVTGDDEMEELFGAKAGGGLSFIIHVVSDNEYHIYTTSVYLGERGEPNWLNTSNKTPGKPTVPIGSYIEPIYRTVLIRANTSSPFEIKETKAGRAQSAWYDENRSNANITQIPSFNVKTWQEI